MHVFIRSFGRLLLASLFCCSLSVVKAGSTPPLIKVLDGSQHQVHKDSSVLVQNNVFYDTSYKNKTEAPYNVKNTVTLHLNEAAAIYLKGPFQVTVSVRITYTNSGLVVDSVDKNLTINFDTAGRYNSRNSFIFSGGQRVTVTILSISSTAAWDVTPALLVENQLEAFPVYKFSCKDNAVQSISYTAPIVSNPDELVVNWPNSIGADVYDLEWAYIDSSALAGNKLYGNPVNPSLVFANNATRITTSQLSYSIPIIYDNTGTLFFRVRAVQEKTGDLRTETNWSSDYQPAGLGQFTFRGHERLLNWQSTATYAEEGKRKVVVQYYDGSLRARQTVTKDNSTNTTVVAETFYDKQGRPAIQVLPAPTLNTILQYSQNFNIGLNGGEYDKTNYDTLISASAFCGTGALAMATSGGSSNYYSTANTLKNTGLNSYIPDAKGFPFTETEYTQDNTGRIKRQSGAGPDHQLGSSHETLYYYGSPDQAELDALFGTEAGDKSHYFKNMVRDANGQYSVSYVDMHGRTIATALAGLPPAGIHLDTLSSYKADNITESLADSGSAVIKDLVTTHTKSLLVATRTTYTFNYVFDPATLIKADCQGDSVHYHCLYNLEIKMTDDCNNQKLPQGKAFDTTISNFTMSTIDTALGSTKGFHVNFSLELPEGNYEITKNLSVSDYALQYYRDSIFQSKNTCSSLSQWIQTQRSLVMNSQCRPDCQSCRDSLGSWDSFRVRYMQMGGIATEDTAANRGSAWAAYQSAISACNALCGSTTDSDDIRSAMLTDISAPSGQYANPDNSGDPYSVFYIKPNTTDYIPIYRKASLVYLDEEGHTDQVYDDSTDTYVLPQKLDARQFAIKFKTSWAATLLPYHPEYCKLVEYEKHAASNQWDRQFAKVDNFATASSMGYLNPTANPALPFSKYIVVIGNKDPLATENTSYKNQLENKLRVYQQFDKTPLSMWSMATLLAKCPGGGAACANLYTSNESAFNTSSMCSGDLDMAWLNFRQLYSEFKKTIVAGIITGSCTNTSAQTLIAAGHQPNFNNASDALSQNGLGYMAGLDTAKAKDSARAAMGSYYCATCSSYAKLWVQQLAPCKYSTDVLNNVIIPRLEQVCIKGSDADHPLGATSISQDSVNTFKSFFEVLNKYNLANGITDALHCNADLITTPQPYSQQSVYSNKPVWTKPSDCECSTISALYQEYLRYGVADHSFSAFLLRTRNTQMSESDLTQLRNSCNGLVSCNYLSKPIYLPPALQCNTGSVCVTCSQVDSLYALFQSNYPGNTPTSAAIDTVQQLKNTFFANFMNNRLGYSKQAWEYLAFKAQCDSAKIAEGANNCTDVVAASSQAVTINTCFSTTRNPAYNVEGAFIYSSTQDTVGTEIEDNTGFWRNDPTGNTSSDLADGRLNRVGVWLCDSTSGNPYYTWEGFTVPVYIPATDTVFIGMAGDNKIRVTIDGRLFKLQDQYPWHNGGVTIDDATPFLRWHVYPVYLAKGYHNFTIEGYNDESYASFGAEIYHATRAQLLTADSNTIKSLTLFSTSQVAQHQSFPAGHSCPIGYAMDSTGGNYTCSKAVPCVCKDIIPATYQTVTLSSCFSDVKDAAYSAQGTYLYNSTQDTVGVSLTDTNPFWSNTTNGTTDGYLNRVGIWPCDNDSLPQQQWIGFTVPVSIPATGVYYIGMASDNQERISVDGTLFKELDQQSWNRYDGNKDKDANPFLKWHIYPVTLIKGYHNLTVEAWNTALKGSFGAEIYNATQKQLLAADSNSIKNYILFSTTQVGQHQTFNAGYNCANGYVLDSTGGSYTCKEEVPCSNLSYSGLHLCGSSDPIFSTVVVDSISSCSDSSFFAISKGTELFNLYSDSLKGSFETDYRNLCLQAYRHERFTVSHVNSEYHYTLYYYDQAGNLVKTVPPQGVAVNRNQSWLDSVSQARVAHADLPNASHTLATQYRYNTLNQVTAQHTPDAGSSRYWYDRLGRLVLSQNAKQILSSDYSYTLYDAIGRITEVGQINNVQAMDDSISRVPDRLTAWINTVATTKNQITQTVYDVSYRPIDSVGLFHAVNLRNRVAYTSFYPTQADLYPGGQQSATYYSYDIHGNVDTLLQDYKGLTTMNKANRFKRMVYQYDLVSGKVNSVAYQPNQPDAFYHRYSHDAENRITNVETSHDSVYWENEAYYEYYKHGPLARTVTGQQQVQGTDYVYTLHGWLKAVNPLGSSTDGTAGSLVAADAYQYHLNYYGNDYMGIAAVSPSVNVPAQLGTDYRPLYNGNISSMAVNIGRLQNPLLYNYHYDQLNRLTDMDAWKADSSFSTLAKISDFAERISYDANGNILKYQRNGNNTFAGKPLGMDSLTYSYLPGTNKLDHINDAVKADNYTEDIDDQLAGNYNYDAIGNLVKDDAGGISNINWTVYGKIDSITKTNGTTIKYLYDAAGNRISKTVKQGGITSTTGYVRDASGNVMSVYTAADTANSGHLMQSEVDLYGSSRLGIWKPGIDVDYLTPATDTIVPLLGTGYSLTFTRGNKLFELSNHLGNVLTTLSDKKLQHTSDSATVDYYKPDVVSAGDYYPFGMGMPGRSYSAGSSYRYGFNGKELDKDLDGNNYDYGFRIYNPQIGKFLSVDPLTKKFPNLSNYQYASNNPVIGIDLDGLELLPVNSSIYRLKYFAGYSFLTAPIATNVVETVYKNIPDVIKDPIRHELKYSYGGVVGANGKDLNVDIIQERGENQRYYNPGPEFWGGANDATLDPTGTTSGLYTFNTRPGALEQNEANVNQLASGAEATEHAAGIIGNWLNHGKKEGMNKEAENRKLFYYATNLIAHNNELKSFGGQKLSINEVGSLTNFVLDGYLPTEGLNNKNINNQQRSSILSNALNIANHGVQALQQIGATIRQATIENVNGLIKQYKDLGGGTEFDNLQQNLKK